MSHAPDPFGELPAATRLREVVSAAVCAVLLAQQDVLPLALRAVPRSGDLDGVVAHGAREGLRDALLAVLGRDHRAERALALRGSAPALDAMTLDEARAVASVG